jgi:hypothetical protein
MSIAPAAAATSAAVQQNQGKQENTKAEAASSENIKGNVALIAKQQLNVQILEASAKVSLTAGDNSQSLLFRAAIDRINELLAPEFGANAIQNAAASQDNSAEATAGRILSMSTGFYEIYAQQHPGEDPEKLATDFVALIRGGFEKGYGEARDILQSLNVLSGEVASGISQTYELVQKGYDDFLAGKLAAINKPVNTEA